MISVRSEYYGEIDQFDETGMSEKEIMEEAQELIKQFVSSNFWWEKVEDEKEE